MPISNFEKKIFFKQNNNNPLCLPDFGSVADDLGMFIRSATGLLVQIDEIKDPLVYKD